MSPCKEYHLNYTLLKISFWTLGYGCDMHVHVYTIEVNEMCHIIFLGTPKYLQKTHGRNSDMSQDKQSSEALKYPNNPTHFE